MILIKSYSKVILSEARLIQFHNDSYPLQNASARFVKTKLDKPLQTLLSVPLVDLEYNEQDIYTKISRKGEPSIYKTVPLSDPYSYTIRDKVLFDISKRIEIATKLNLTSRHGSSLFSTTNYGLGGSIVSHIDPHGYEKGVPILNDDLRRFSMSGDYLATFMGWFEHTLAGGHTAFIAKHFEGKLVPNKGSAAFWINLSPSHEKEGRSIHGGCPVLLGSKWIINKWIYSWDQWKEWPCGVIEQASFSPFQGMSS